MAGRKRRKANPYVPRLVPKISTSSKVFVDLTFAGYKKRLTTERLNACLEGAGSKVRVRIRKGVCQAYVGGKSIDLDAGTWYSGSTFSSAGLFA